MNLATSYAKALFEVAKRDTTSAPEVFKNLRESLRRRGHEKLLPRIYSEFEKLELGEERLKEYKKISPEAERTRTLLELYRKLISTHTA
jgi:F0F1-type ATP synthase delta subunit